LHDLFPSLPAEVVEDVCNATEVAADFDRCVQKSKVCIIFLSYR
jgi:hypothetical protein